MLSQMRETRSSRLAGQSLGTGFRAPAHPPQGSHGYQSPSCQDLETQSHGLAEGDSSQTVRERERDVSFWLDEADLSPPSMASCLASEEKAQ